MITLFSPAKLNLSFRVLGKRKDGYHEISSIYQAVSLGDLISIGCSAEDSFFCTERTLCNSSNLVLLALQLFRKKTGWIEPVAITLKKRIPIQSGLGGGSSNAATTLWALNELSGRLVAPQELMDWSSELGSDVPFFFSSGRASCSGRGEIVSEVIPDDMRGSLWIAKPKWSLSTAAVYAEHDIKPFLQQESEPCYFNDLEETAMRLIPELKGVKASLVNMGFGHVFMTGSGTAFVCISSLSTLIPKTTQIADIDFYRVQYTNRKQGFWYECEDV